MIYAILWRTILFGFIIVIVEFIHELKPKIGEKYPLTAWNTLSVFKLLILFLVVEHCITLIGYALHDDSIKYLKNETWEHSLTTTIFYVFVVGFIWYFIVIRSKESFRAVGFHKNNIKSGLLWGVYILLFIEILFILSKYFRIASTPLDIQRDILGYLRIIAIGPIAEEVFFRGFVYPNFRKKSGVIWAMILSSACFSIMHQGDSYWSTFIIGIILCIAYEKSGSLLAPIIGHIFINAFICIRQYLFGSLIYLTQWSTIWSIAAITVCIYIMIRRYYPGWCKNYIRYSSDWHKCPHPE